MEKEKMEQNLNETERLATIPYFAHESEMNRLERTNKRLLILLIIIFVSLIGTNAGWIWYESQFMDEVITQEVTQDTDSGGNNNNYFYGGDYNGNADNTDYSFKKN